ncbi:MAG: hypothetical protein H6810_10615 [Phycisphaeraceae bacterium]|nr:MAG: hypothetical protein H6810_10615 [Phycisphaeraceae bacterium]
MHRTTALALVAAAVVTAQADVIYESTGPFGGAFGLWGADVFSGQTVAQRFAPTADYRLDLARLWFMSNDFAGSVDEHVTVTIQTDATLPGGPDASVPSGVALDAAEFTVSAVGWDPVQEAVTFAGRPWLFAGERYWIVCASDADGGLDPVWSFASEGLGFNAFRLGADPWQPGGAGAELCMTVEATASACLADLAPPEGVLDLSDIQAFVAAFLSRAPAADVAQPYGVFDLADLAAFVGSFLSGCP